jgi:23S rRNA pseudouridine1911/1915/1917 synthase
MSFWEHPLLGDDLYGGEMSLINRQALHCRQISFVHPFFCEEMTYIAPLPQDMHDVLQADQ